MLHGKKIRVFAVVYLCKWIVNRAPVILYDGCPDMAQSPFFEDAGGAAEYTSSIYRVLSEILSLLRASTIIASHKLACIARTTRRLISSFQNKSYSARKRRQIQEKMLEVYELILIRAINFGKLNEHPP